LDRELIKQDLRTIAAAIFDHLKTKDGKWSKKENIENIN
jgi:hypothetical protein